MDFDQILIKMSIKRSKMDQNKSVFTQNRVNLFKNGLKSIRFGPLVRIRFSSSVWNRTDIDVQNCWKLKLNGRRFNSETLIAQPYNARLTSLNSFMNQYIFLRLASHRDGSF